MSIDDRLGGGFDRNDFAWRKTNIAALRKWLVPLDTKSINECVRRLEARSPCFLHRHEDGTITIEEPF